MHRVLCRVVGRDVTALCLFPGENEVLLPPNVNFKITAKVDAGNGLVRCLRYTPRSTLHSMHTDQASARVHHGEQWIVQCQQTKTFDKILDLGKAAAANTSVPAVVAAPRVAELVKADAPIAELVELDAEPSPPVDLEPELSPALVVPTPVVQATAAPALVVSGTAEQPAAVADKMPRDKNLRAWQRGAQELVFGGNALRAINGHIRKV